MELKEAINILDKLNKCRKDKSSPLVHSLPSGFKIGLAIDLVVNTYKTDQEEDQEIEIKNQLNLF